MKTNRRYGIELEMFGVNKESIVEALAAQGIKVAIDNRNAGIQPHWKIVPDGSVSHEGFELVSPILSGNKGLETIKKVSQVLLKLGIKIDKSCGFHVHVETKDYQLLDFKNVIARYSKNEATIDQWMAPSRRKNANGFCRSMHSSHMRIKSKFFDLPISQAISDSLYDRGYKLNLLAFPKHGTIEFRHHHGTIHYAKIIPWIEFCVNFIENSKISTKDTIFSKLEVVNISKIIEVLNYAHGMLIPLPINSIAYATKIKSNLIVSLLKKAKTYAKIRVLKTKAGYIIPENHKISTIWKSFISSPEFFVKGKEETKKKSKSSDDIFEGLTPEIVSYFKERIEAFKIKSNKNPIKKEIQPLPSPRGHYIQMPL